MVAQCQVQAEGLLLQPESIVLQVVFGGQVQPMAKGFLLAEVIGKPVQCVAPLLWPMLLAEE
jgi:hypothetical protein